MVSLAILLRIYARMQCADDIDLDGDGPVQVQLHPELFHHPAERRKLCTISSETPLSTVSRKIQIIKPELTTVPPCKWMILEHPRYPWKINVTAKVPLKGHIAGVTANDVVEA